MTTVTNTAFVQPSPSSNRIYSIHRKKLLSKPDKSCVVMSTKRSQLRWAVDAFFDEHSCSFFQLRSGKAEIFGTELAINQKYQFTSGMKFAIFTYWGCTVNVRTKIEKQTDLVVHLDHLASRWLLRGTRWEPDAHLFERTWYARAIKAKGRSGQNSWTSGRRRRSISVKRAKAIFFRTDNGDGSTRCR